MQLVRVVYSSLVRCSVPGEGDVVPTETVERISHGALHCTVIVRSWTYRRGVSDRYETRNDPACALPQNFEILDLFSLVWAVTSEVKL